MDRDDGKSGLLDDRPKRLDGRTVIVLLDENYPSGLEEGAD